MADNPYAPSNLGGVAPSPAAPAYAPSFVAPATTGYLQTLPTKPSVAPLQPSTYSPSDIVKEALYFNETGASPDYDSYTTLTGRSAGAESDVSLVGVRLISPTNQDGSRDYGY